MSEQAPEYKLTPFVQIEHHNIALLLSNYLNSKNIRATLIERDGKYYVACDSEYLAQAKAIFEEFIENPNHPKYQQAAWQNGQVTDVNEHSSIVANNFLQQFLSHAGIVTLTVFIACWCVFLASLLGFSGEMFSMLHFYQQLSIENLLSEPLRLLGPALFHFSWLHIAFNTMWWWQLGGNIEKTLGKGALINLLLASAIISNVGQFYVSGPNFGGLSGVVYALVGYVWWYGWLAPEKGLGLSKAIIGFLLFWLLLGYTDVMPVNMANTAHLLGLVTGCLLAVFNIFVLKKNS